MAQHRIMSILLFVCLSLCFEVAQSQLQPPGGPCMTNSQCQSRCCSRSSLQGSGQCVSGTNPFVNCYGPEDGGACFRSNECNSGCCVITVVGSRTRCVERGLGVNCLGPNNGESCYSSDQCNSGCCFRDNAFAAPKCGPKRPQECFGPNNGNFCSLSAACDSGCCRRKRSLTGIPQTRCAAKAKENAPCERGTNNGFYQDSCPCANGFTCQRDQIGNPSCKKPRGK
ncbi:keratin-associated protein 10-1-like isoform X1 [Eleutherodactylus coqui]|uniref:keratin-associated protein 10-1-like isoform X1 n=1 Tax=Eleutherodactylus coqui TaxID=57060 RepID=UPI00346203CA